MMAQDKNHQPNLMNLALGQSVAMVNVTTQCD